ncbi:hypothetical protein [Streptomyces sp. GC420]|uniref:hypothetical protein n=1 Tax=Streptomyces sp. GC420 TaxID=2697568 RepID=UPI001414E693|nr:hypothetical protein [Streptomyces sp. GC420]NBM15947.1 hypothetical protein [Streptomyces sp. GC420]
MIHLTNRSRDRASKYGTRGSDSPKSEILEGSRDQSGSFSLLRMPQRRAAEPKARIIVAASLTLTALGVLAVSHARQGDLHRAQPEAVSDSRMILLLKSLLPEGKVSQPLGLGTGNSGYKPAAQLIFDDGHGPSLIKVSIGKLSIPFPQDASACPYRAYQPYGECDHETLKNGDTITLNREMRSHGKPHSVKQWTALFTTKDGSQVSVSEWNAESPEARKTSRPTLPLAEGQLKAVASSGVWREVVSAVPAATTPPPPPSTPLMTREKIREVLRSGLPRELRVADEEGPDSGFVALTVDDGAGKALLTVSVQKWKPESADIGALFSEVAPRPDGLLAMVRKSTPTVGYGKGTIEWGADTLRNDGVRALVTEINAPAYGLAAERRSHPLTKKQLMEIALSISEAATAESTR